MIRRGLGVLAGTLTLREQSHRRATLLGICALLLLSTSPVFGHHLPFDTERLLEGIDHVGTLCLTAVHLLFTPVHSLVHVALIAGVVYAAWNRYQASRLLGRSIALVEVHHVDRDDLFWRAATAAKVDPTLLRVVPGLPVPAFTAGLLRPRIYLSRALSSHLDGDELAAVIAHEGAHAARRDPLRLALLRALACTLFWIPALRRLAEDVSDQAELSADAAAAGDRPLVLASALLRVASWPAGGPSRAAVGFRGTARVGRSSASRRGLDLLECRVRRLAGEPTPVRSHVTRRSLIGAAAALSLVWLSGALMAHPLPADAEHAHARHCDHREESAVAHLFCLGSPFSTAAVDCPHKHA